MPVLKKPPARLIGTNTGNNNSVRRKRSMSRKNTKVKSIMNQSKIFNFVFAIFNS